MSDNLDDLFGPGDEGDEGKRHADRLRRHGHAREQDTAEYEVGERDYKPYGVRPRSAQTCNVRMWKALRADIPEGIIFDYRLLTMVRYSYLDLDQVRQEINLMFPDMIIRIVGRYLDDLLERLSERQVKFIQQLSQMVHHISPDCFGPNEAVIEEIEILSLSDHRFITGNVNDRPH